MDEAAGTIETRAGETARSRAGQENVERILDRALEIFATFGFRGTRIDQIAVAAGLSKTNLLYYFRRKEDLYLAVLQRTLDMWLEPLQSLDAGGDPATAISGYIRQKLTASRDAPAASRLFALEVIQGAPILGPVLETQLADLVARKERSIQSWVDAGKIVAVSPRHLIYTLWATTQHYADFAAQIRAIEGRDLSDPAYFEETCSTVTAMVLRGILPR